MEQGACLSVQRQDIGAVGQVDDAVMDGWRTLQGGVGAGVGPDGGVGVQTAGIEFLPAPDVGAVPGDDRVGAAGGGSGGRADKPTPALGPRFRINGAQAAGVIGVQGTALISGRPIEGGAERRVLEFRGAIVVEAVQDPGIPGVDPDTVIIDDGGAHAGSDGGQGDGPVVLARTGIGDHQITGGGGSPAGLGEEDAIEPGGEAQHAAVSQVLGPEIRAGGGIDSVEILLVRAGGRAGEEDAALAEDGWAHAGEEVAGPESGQGAGAEGGGVVAIP